MGKHNGLGQQGPTRPNPKDGTDLLNLRIPHNPFSENDLGPILKMSKPISEKPERDQSQ